MTQGTQPVLLSAAGLDYAYAYVSEMTQTSVIARVVAIA
jgi:hypothetical protein